MDALSIKLWWFLLTRATVEATKYAPDWRSLDSRPLPDWYDRAKVGIFMHFGPYAVPGYETAAFWQAVVNNRTDRDHACARYLREYYPPNFAYQDFGPMLTMDLFDPDRLVDIVAASGAKYFVFTSKHHDGFCNWGSTYSYGWNSMAVGPKRDVLAELSGALRARHPDVHFGLYYSLFEWFNPIYLKDKDRKYHSREYPLHKAQPELKELVTRFSPDVLWADGDWEASPEYWGSKDFLAWLYNESPSKDTIVTNDRWGNGTRLRHGGFFSGPDRFDPGVLQSRKWEDALTVDREWGYRRNINIEEIISMEQLITKVARAVSCGGNILLNVGPTKEGTIIPIFQERLFQLGSWLQVNGEAIYSSKPWKYQNDSFNGNVWYTKKGSVVYGIVLGWPEDDVVQLSDPQVVRSTTIEMLGLGGVRLRYAVDPSTGRVSVRFPSMSDLERSCGSGCQWGHVLKFVGLADADKEGEVYLEVIQ